MRVVSQCVECACFQERMPNTVCWSNGNLFRCITLLAVTHLEKAGIVRIAHAAESLLVMRATFKCCFDSITVYFVARNFPQPR